jgi:hypothetical protein
MRGDQAIFLGGDLGGQHWFVFGHAVELEVDELLVELGGNKKRSAIELPSRVQGPYVSRSQCNEGFGVLDLHRCWRGFWSRRDDDLDLFLLNNDAGHFLNLWRSCDDDGLCDCLDNRLFDRFNHGLDNGLFLRDHAGHFDLFFAGGQHEAGHQDQYQEVCGSFFNRHFYLLLFRSYCLSPDGFHSAVQRLNPILKTLIVSFLSPPFSPLYSKGSRL